LNPKNSGPNIKSIQFLPSVGGKNKGRLGFQKKSLDLVSGLVD